MPSLVMDCMSGRMAAGIKDNYLTVSVMEKVNIFVQKITQNIMALGNKVCVMAKEYWNLMNKLHMKVSLGMDFVMVKVK